MYRLVKTAARKFEQKKIDEVATSCPSFPLSVWSHNVPFAQVISRWMAWRISVYSTSKCVATCRNCSTNAPCPSLFVKVLLSDLMAIPPLVLGFNTAVDPALKAQISPSQNPPESH